jgi:Zn-finger protein
MQKIILTEKTVGTIIDRLRKLTSGFYNLSDAKNVNPLRCKSWKDSGLGDRAACADITVHWMFKETKHPIVSGRKKNEAGFPLIHMAFDAECAMCFSYGDVFYFKGNKIIINQTAGAMIDCQECTNIVTKIVVTKYLKNMTADDFDFVQQGKCQAEMSAQAWQGMADDTANDFHEFWGEELYV